MTDPTPSSPDKVVAIVTVRSAALAAGGLEAAAEAGGHVIIVGTGCERAADALTGIADVVRTAESAAPFAALAVWLASQVSEHRVVILAASADGRDLAPLIARALSRPLLANALTITQTGATCARRAGEHVEDVVIDGPFVATLVPGARGTVGVGAGQSPRLEALAPHADDTAVSETIAVLAADLATVELAEATRIVSGGAGLDSKARFGQLSIIGEQLGAALGGTRVATDRGWLEHDRQIGTTGVVVDPDVYLAFGISGAVQHTSGLGRPEHIVSVNLDPNCPMMKIADLALVADANAVVEALATRLGERATARDATDPAAGSVATIAGPGGRR
jgi:electron transfer flavoprotein alpha subunit